MNASAWSQAGPYLIALIIALTALLGAWTAYLQSRTSALKAQNEGQQQQISSNSKAVNALVQSVVSGGGRDGLPTDDSGTSKTSTFK